MLQSFYSITHKDGHWLRPRKKMCALYDHLFLLNSLTFLSPRDSDMQAQDSYL